LRDDSQAGWIGYGIGRQNLFPGRGIPLAINGPPIHCYLHVLHTLVQAHGVLITDESSFGLYLDQDLDNNLFHYD
jgi:hypothetical protein